MPIRIKIQAPLQPKASGRGTNLVETLFSQKIRATGDKSLPTDSPGTGITIQFDNPILRNPTQSNGFTNIVLDAGDKSDTTEGVVEALQTDGVELRLGNAGGGDSDPMICGIMQHWPFRSLGLTNWTKSDSGFDSLPILDTGLPMFDTPSGLNIWGNPPVSAQLEPYPPWVPGVADMRFHGPETTGYPEESWEDFTFSFCESFRSQPNPWGPPTQESTPLNILRPWTDGNPDPESISDPSQAVTGGQFAFTGTYLHELTYQVGTNFRQYLPAHIDRGRRLSFDRTGNGAIISGFSSLIRTTPMASPEFIGDSLWKKAMDNAEIEPFIFNDSANVFNLVHEATIANSSDFCFIFRMFNFIPASKIQWQLRIYPHLDTVLKEYGEIPPDDGRGFFSCYSTDVETGIVSDQVGVYYSQRILVKDIDGNEEWQPGEKLVQFVAEETRLDMASFQGESEPGGIPAAIPYDSYQSNVLDPVNLHFPIFAFLGHEQMCIMIPYASETLGIHCGYSGLKRDSPFFLWESVAEFDAGSNAPVEFDAGYMYACGAPLLPRAIFEVRARYELNGVQHEQVFRLDHRLNHVVTDA